MLPKSLLTFKPLNLLTSSCSSSSVSFPFSLRLSIHHCSYRVAVSTCVSNNSTSSTCSCQPKAQSLSITSIWICFRVSPPDWLGPIRQPGFRSAADAAPIRCSLWSRRDEEQRNSRSLWVGRLSGALRGLTHC